MLKSTIIKITSALVAILLFTGCDNSKEGGGAIDVNIEVIETTEFSTTVKFTPGAGASKFNCAISLTNDPSQLTEYIISDIQKFDNAEPREITFYDLRPAAKYYIMAQAFDKDGTGQKVSTKETITGTEIVAGVDIKILNTSFDSVRVEFFPDPKAKKFKTAIATLEDEIAFRNGTLEGIITKDKQEDFHTFKKLTPNKDYVIFTQGVNSDGQLASRITKSTTRTKDAGDVKYDIIQINNSVATIKYTPSDHCTKAKNGMFIFFIAPRGDFQKNLGREEKEITGNLLLLSQLGGLPMADYEAVMDWTIRTKPNTIFTSAILAIWTEEDTGKVKNRLLLSEFTTPDKNEDAPPASVTITTSNITANSADITVTPAEGTYLYYFHTVPEKYYEPMLEAYGIAAMKKDIITNGFKNIRATTINKKFEGAGIGKGEKIRVMAFAYNENGIISESSMILHDFDLLNE